MKCLIQRVSEAAVRVEGDVVGEIDRGLVVFAGLERDDDESRVARMVDRLLSYRVFSDELGKMNLSVSDIAGGLLLVSQFTLAADTRKGRRPSFSSAAEPALAEALFQSFCEQLWHKHPNVATGRFGADMKVSLVNDGPVTFMLQS